MTTLVGFRFPPRVSVWEELCSAGLRSARGRAQLRPLGRRVPTVRPVHGTVPNCGPPCGRLPAVARQTLATCGAAPSTPCGERRWNNATHVPLSETSLRDRPSAAPVPLRARDRDRVAGLGGSRESGRAGPGRAGFTPAPDMGRAPPDRSWRGPPVARPRPPAGKPTATATEVTPASPGDQPTVMTSRSSSRRWPRPAPVTDEPHPVTDGPRPGTGTRPPEGTSSRPKPEDVVPTGGRS